MQIRAFNSLMNEAERSTPIATSPHSRAGRNPVNDKVVLMQERDFPAPKVRSDSAGKDWIPACVGNGGTYKDLVNKRCQNNASIYYGLSARPFFVRICLD
jgi:hypothetical protein